MGETIKINQEKCIGCGLCVKDCPSSYLYLKNKKARTRKTGCMECGHCFAICPKEAVEMVNYPDFVGEPVVSLEEMDSETLLKGMKSRRTIRQFKPQKIEAEVLEKILEAGRYAPTGVNAQGTTFTILNKEKDVVEKEAVRFARKAFKLASPFAKITRTFKIDKHFFFKGAPTVILVSGKSQVDAGLASAYMELMANSLGIGVLYSGFFCMAYKLSGKIRRMVGLPKGDKLVSCMVIGYPAVKYQRTVPRDEIKKQER